MKQLFFITFSLLLSLCAYAQNATPQHYAEAILSSNQIIPNETAILEIRIMGGSIDEQPADPIIANTTVRFVGLQAQTINLRQKIYLLKYLITPTEPGIYEIPSVSIKSNRRILKTKPLRLQVTGQAELQKVPTGIEGVNILTTWLTDKDTLYPGEQTNVTLKIYAPEILNVMNWGILEPEKENALAWRFASANTARSRVMIDGEKYISANLVSTLSGIASGAASLKASKLDVTIRQNRDYILNLVIPDLDLKIIPFPSGAPDGFDGAVGNFEIRSHSEKPSFQSNEATEVILQIGGIGNLESLKAPVIGKSAFPDLDWKVINTSKDARGRERQELTGVVTFRQLIRAKVKNKAVLDQPDISIPSYSFSFFNPATKVYKTLTTEPIPVEITAAEEDPFAEDELITTPEEIKPVEMTEILDIIQAPDESNTLSANQRSRFPLWNIIPAALCLFIISLPLIKKLRGRFSKTLDQKEKQKDFRELNKQSTSADFYATAGRYIARWMSDNTDEELQTIINQRDEICFQPESVSNESMAAGRKKEILDLLKKLSIIIISMGIFFSNNKLSAAEDLSPQTAYSNGKYQKALDLYQQSYPASAHSIYDTPADVFYNIGNCYQKLTKPGDAALAWRRALAVDPTHEEARKNLRFIEKEELSYTKSYQPWQTKLTKYQPHIYRLIYQVSFWVFTLSVLSLIFLKNTPWVRASVGVLVVLIVISPFTAALGYATAYLYPDTAFHTDYTAQAIVTSESSLYQEARRKDDNFQVLTPASLVKVIAVRDSWSRVQVIDDNNAGNPQQGWLKTDLIQFITTK